MHDAHPAPFETLREAAALMRKRAQDVLSLGVGWVQADTARRAMGNEIDGDFIASMSPAVALAMADLLDLAATHQVGFTPAPRAHLLNIAHTYLGGDA